jgi:AmiR/NasT family two-component response regulator
MFRDQADLAGHDVLDLATGVLMQQRRCTYDQGFEGLLSMALRRADPVEDVAEWVVVLASLGCVLEDE